MLKKRVRNVKMIKKILAASVLCTGFFSANIYADDDKEIEIDKVKINKKQTKLRIKGEVEGFGRNANLTIRDAQNLDYVVYSVTVRKENFKAKIDLTELVFIPCELAVVVNDDTSIIETISLSQIENCGGYSTKLTGLVADEPIPYATVQVTVNGHTFTTVADEFGAYSLDVLSTSLNELVKIESSATDAASGDEINFTNLVGSFEKIITDSSQNVTNVTTASYVLTVEANGGSEPTSLAELQLAETSVDASQLIEMAAVIKLIVDDPNYQLPDGFTSIIEFVSQTTAVQSFIEQTPESDLIAAQQEILEDSDLVAGFSANEIPSFYYAIATAEPGYLSRSGSALQFEQSGQGNKLGFASWNGQAINQAYNWQIANGRIEINYSTPEEVEYLSDNIESLTNNQAEIDAFYAGGGVNGQISYFQSTIAENYTRVVDGNLVDIINVETRLEKRTPTIILNNGSTLDLQSTLIEITNSQQTFRSNLDIEPIAFNPTCSSGLACVLGQWGGQYNYSEGKRAYDDYIFPETSYAEVINFTNDGTSQGKISGIGANWQVDGLGKLVITYPNGTIQTSQIIDQLGLEYGVFSVFQTSQGEFANYDIWVKGEQSFVLDQTYLAPSSDTHYWNGEINSWIPGSFDSNGLLIPNRLWGWLFGSDHLQNIDGVSWNEPDANGLSSINYVLADPVAYQATADGLVIERLPFAVRYWYPIASTLINGDRVFYIVEREERDAELWFGGEPGFNTFIPSRINIEREIDRADYTAVAR